MKKVYNKLVRDRIPEIIKKNADSCVTKKLNQKEFRLETLKKVVEEANELLAAKDSKIEMIKELADLKEIIDTVMSAHKISNKEVSKEKKIRKKQRGGFEKKVYLIETN
jgi:predicted house-cleaning noncanonical NTP pyrophosphatase (MazG superfamily)